MRVGARSLNSNKVASADLWAWVALWCASFSSTSLRSCVPTASIHASPQLAVVWCGAVFVRRCVCWQPTSVFAHANAKYQANVTTY